MAAQGDDSIFREEVWGEGAQTQVLAEHALRRRAGGGWGRDMDAELGHRSGRGRSVIGKAEGQRRIVGRCRSSGWSLGAPVMMRLSATGGVRSGYIED